MRERLFKAKRKDNGEWLESKCLLQFDDKTAFFPTEFGNIEILPDTLSEYIGLTDKNGKKIFEGNILSDKMSDCISVVKFEDCCFKIENSSGVGIKTTQKAVEWFGLEIVGNIYDNPELLK